MAGFKEVPVSPASALVVRGPVGTREPILGNTWVKPSHHMCPLGPLERPSGRSAGRSGRFGGPLSIGLAEFRLSDATRSVQLS